MKALPAPAEMAAQRQAAMGPTLVGLALAVDCCKSLAGAIVDLATSARAIAQTVNADASGAFRFDSVRAGQYELRARFEGFKSASTRVRVGARPPGAQRLVLSLANIQQEITVSNAVEVSTNASSNVDAVAVDTNMLESLPMFDQDYIATIS